MRLRDFTAYFVRAVSYTRKMFIKYITGLNLILKHFSSSLAKRPKQPVDNGQPGQHINLFTAVIVIR
jgi:hypothetical protein